MTFTNIKRVHITNNLLVLSAKEILEIDKAFLTIGKEVCTIRACQWVLWVEATKLEGDEPDWDELCCTGDETWVKRL